MNLKSKVMEMEMQIASVENADKTMLEKACEWLEENYYNVYQGTWQEIKEQFINDFKKAMEE